MGWNDFCQIVQQQGFQCLDHFVLNKTRGQNLCEFAHSDCSSLADWPADDFCVWLANGLANPNGLPPHRQRRWAPFLKKKQQGENPFGSQCFVLYFVMFLVDKTHSHMYFVSLFLSRAIFLSRHLWSLSRLNSCEAVVWSLRTTFQIFLKLPCLSGKKVMLKLGFFSTFWVLIFQDVEVDFCRCWFKLGILKLDVFQTVGLLKSICLNQHLSGKRMFFIVKPFTVFFTVFFCSASVSRCLSRILYVFVWCFRWASYLRALCSTSGTIRWNTRTGNDMDDIWMQKSGSDSFNMFWCDFQLY